MAVLVVGEVLADIAPAGSTDAAVKALQARPGGSPANVAITLARLGVQVRFGGRISRHGLGPWLAAHLRANGVDLSPSPTANEQPTLAVVTLDAAGQASYGFYGPETADWQWRPAELPDPATVGTTAVHTGSLACALDPGASVIGAWLAGVHDSGSALISLDPNLRPGLPADSERVERLVAHAHLVKASEDDLRTLYPSRPRDAVARDWAARGPALVLITMGATGATAFRPDGTVRTRPAQPMAVVDTVGAGDAFAGGVLAWLAAAGRLHPGGPDSLDDAELDALLDTANTVAAFTCGRQGADPPRRAEVASAAWPQAISPGGPG